LKRRVLGSKSIHKLTDRAKISKKSCNYSRKARRRKRTTSTEGNSLSPGSIPVEFIPERRLEMNFLVREGVFQSNDKDSPSPGGT